LNLVNGMTDIKTDANSISPETMVEVTLALVRHRARAGSSTTELP
jgi:hypothetical protein